MTIQAAPSIAAGLRHIEHFVVDTRHTVPQVDTSWLGFQEMPPVLATAMMVAFIEQTCIRSLSPFLEPGQKTVGIHVDISHIALTPIGMTVTADVELIAVDARTLLFNVSCHDEAGLIGKGTHRRSIIDATRFMQRLQDKQAAAMALRADVR